MTYAASSACTAEVYILNINCNAIALVEMAWSSSTATDRDRCDSCSPLAARQCSAQASSTPPNCISSSPETLHAACPQERKQRKHDVLTSMPMQPHGRLHLHGIAEAPEGVAALLKSAAEKRRQRTRSNYSNMSSVNSSMTKASRGSSWRRSSGV